MVLEYVPRSTNMQPRRRDCCLNCRWFKAVREPDGPSQEGICGNPEATEIGFVRMDAVCDLHSLRIADQPSPSRRGLSHLTEETRPSRYWAGYPSDWIRSTTPSLRAIWTVLAERSPSRRLRYRAYVCLALIGGGVSCLLAGSVLIYSGTHGDEVVWLQKGDWRVTSSGFGAITMLASAIWGFLAFRARP